MSGRKASTTFQTVYHYFSQYVFPKSQIDWLIIIAVAYSALSYWLISMWRHPSEPLSVIALYGFGDIQQFHLLRSLPKLDLTFSVNPPWIGFIPHALFFLGFKFYGLILADLLIVLLTYCLLVRFFEALGIASPYSKFTSLIILSHVTEFIKFSIKLSHIRYISHLLVSQNIVMGLLVVSVVILRIFFTESGRRVFHKIRDLCPFFLITPFLFVIFLYTGHEVWNLRVQRPFVSYPIFLLLFCLLFRLTTVNWNVQRTRTWVMSGLCYAYLFQIDPFLTFAITIMAAITLPTLLFLRQDLRPNFRSSLKILLVLSVSFLVGAAPFLFQRSQRPYMNSEYFQRFGLFSTHRLDFYVLPSSCILMLFILLASVYALFFMVKKHNSYLARRYAVNIKILCAFCCASYIALPVFNLAFGWLIEPYHFIGIFFQAIALSSLVLMMLFFIFFFLKIQLPKLLKVIAIMIYLLCLMSSTYRAFSRSEISGPARNLNYSIPQSYRGDFNKLTQILALSQGKQRVLGTFDLQVSVWWSSFTDGLVFLTDPSFDMSPDHAIETKLITFCKLLGMTPGQFESFVSNSTVLVYWVAVDKYQASKAHTYSSFDDYSIVGQRAIRESDQFANWQQILPNSEKIRLVKAFEELDLNSLNLRLDLIVLPHFEGLSHLSPVDRAFKLIYTNPSFSAWERERAKR